MKKIQHNFFKNKSFLVFNIIGSTIGMTVTMLILLWVYSTHSHDQYSNINHAGTKRRSNQLMKVGPDMLFSGSKFSGCG